MANKADKKVPEGGTGFGRDHQGNPTGAPHGNGSKLMNMTKPTSGGQAPMPPKNTSAAYGSSCGD